MMLADQGADVIKVEPTVGGDITRANAVLIGGISGLVANMNRGKRGLAVDVTSPEGLEFLLRLCDTADVFVQNFRPGVLERLQIDFGQLAEQQPAHHDGRRGGKVEPTAKMAGRNKTVIAFGYAAKIGQAVKRAGEEGDAAANRNPVRAARVDGFARFVEILVLTCPNQQARGKFAPADGERVLGMGSR